MYKKRSLLVVFISAIIGTLIFHRQAPGLNILLFELMAFIYLLATKQVGFKGKNQITLSLALLVTAFATVFTYSVFAITVNILVFFVFVGVLIYPEVKSLANSILLSVANVAGAQDRFFSTLSKSKISGRNLRKRFKRLGIFLIPLLIIFVFVFIYRQSNPVFDQVMDNIWEFIDDYILSVFDNIDILIVLTFLLFLFISNFVYLRTSLESIITGDKNADDELKREKTAKSNYFGKVNFKITGLNNELKAAVFLLVTLNILILILNITDISWVWFNFSWEGQYLKEFVHEGTYLLIVSILISIALVLFYFRKNLNFYSKNKTLKYLSYAWIAQNALLAVSLGVRNIRYIEYFSLAYKRIGIFIFLILTLHGLYTVFIKVKDKRSPFYLFRTNTYAVLVVLVISSVFNWDAIIAKYNFAHADKSYLHLDFMSGLSDKTLPYLDKPIEEVKKLKTDQGDYFEFESRDAVQYMTPEKYCDIIKVRKEDFIKEWESKSIWEWNWPEYQAYLALKK